MRQESKPRTMSVKAASASRDFRGRLLLFARLASSGNTRTMCWKFILLDMGFVRRMSAMNVGNTDRQRRSRSLNSSEMIPRQPEDFVERQCSMTSSQRFQTSVVKDNGPESLHCRPGSERFGIDSQESKARGP